MSLERSIERLGQALNEAGVPWALIGGLALAARGALRTTGDIDFLVPGEADETVHSLMYGLGYRSVFRSEDVANYRSSVADLGDVDFLFARRAYARGMLERADEQALGLSLPLRVLQVEDLIGLKVQSSSNDLRRHSMDVADIERLIAANPRFDEERVREYFRIFEREPELESLLERVRSK